MSFQTSDYYYQRPWLPFRNWFGPKRWASLHRAARHAGRVRKLELGFDYDLSPHAADFARLTHLRYLYLCGWGGPPFTGEPSFALPATIGQLTELREVVLFNLAISEVSVWLTSLPQLRYLILRGTDITELPADFGRLHRLQVLRLENCQFPLRTLPASFRELTALRHLSFADTYVRHLPIEHLPPQLEQLDLSVSSLYAGVDYDELRARFPRLRVRNNGVR